MKHPIALATFAALATSLGAAQAQPRRLLPAHVAPSVASTQWVVQRGAGQWRPTCTASAGCAAPRAIPRCAAGTMGAAMTFADVIDQRFRLDGHAVAVRARLGAAAGCTEMACPEGACCNHCGGPVSLTGTARSSLRQLSLGAADDPAFTCRGDDSGLCCGTAVPTGDVIARGVLRPIAGSGGAWRIESPTLCTPG